MKEQPPPRPFAASSEEEPSIVLLVPHPKQLKVSFSFQITRITIQNASKQEENLAMCHTRKVCLSQQKWTRSI